MASLSVRAGLSAAHNVSNAAIVLVGQQKHLKKLTASAELLDKFSGRIDEASWTEAMRELPDKGTLPLCWNRARVLSVGNNDGISRYNSPSLAYNIYTMLKSMVFPAETKTVNIVAVVEYAHTLASVAAIARCFPTFSRKTKKDNKIEEIHIDVVVVDNEKLSSDDTQMLNDLSLSVREVQRLIDTPANELTTDELVAEAKSVAETLEVKYTLIQGEELLEKGFGGIYHVGKAGPTPPAFMVLHHEPEGATETLALVGKGVCFDTGGMQIKTKTGMPSMKDDMGGAAVMLETFATLVKSGFKQNLHVCLCIVENNISPLANKPDDIITLLSGKTVEITNTDAEGRLILADGVYYAAHTLKAGTIIDAATLTGAQKDMTGRMHSAVMTNCGEWEEKACRAGRASGDLTAPMVFCPELHFADLKSPVADMKNSNLGKMEGPASSIAGLFIGSHIEFGEKPKLSWLHFDIAAPAWTGERATGYGPALLTTLLGEHTDVPLLKLPF